MHADDGLKFGDCVLLNWNEKSVNDRNTQRNIDRFDVLMNYWVADEPYVKVDTIPQRVVAVAVVARPKHHSCCTFCLKRDHLKVGKWFITIVPE